MIIIRSYFPASATSLFFPSYVWFLPLDVVGLCSDPSGIVPVDVRGFGGRCVVAGADPDARVGTELLCSSRYEYFVDNPFSGFSSLLCTPVDARSGLDSDLIPISYLVGILLLRCSFLVAGVAHARVNVVRGAGTVIQGVRVAENGESVNSVPGEGSSMRESLTSEYGDGVVNVSEHQV